MSFHTEAMAETWPTRALAFVRAWPWLVITAITFGCTPVDPLEAIERQQAMGDMAGSIEPLRALLEERKDDPKLLFLYGRALSVTATPSEALWALRGAMEDPEWLVPAGLALTAGAYRTRNFTVALDAIERVLAAHPDDIDALLLRAQSHAAQKLDYEQALADAERVLEVEPDNVTAMEPKILALLGLDRIDEAGAAMEELGEAIRNTQLSADGLAWHCATMAIFAFDGGHIDLSRERWAACLEEFPSHAQVIEKAIRFYDAQQEWDTSLDVLRNALEAAPEANVYRVSLAQRLRSRGDVDEAERLLRVATEFETRELQLGGWLGLVTHFQELGEYAKAAEAAGRAVGVAGSAGAAPPQLLFDYADALIMAGEYDAATVVAESIQVEAYRELLIGRSLLMRGEPGAALEHFSEAFRLWPDNTFARYYAARAAEEVADFDRAIEEYRYAIRLDPGATDARQRLGKLHAAEGKPIMALHVLRTKANEIPLDLDGDLLSIKLFAWVGHRDPLSALIERHRRHPGEFSRAIASAAEGLELRAGPEVALRAIDTTEGMRLEDPVHIEAFRAWVAISLRAGRSDAAIERIERALVIHPRSADLLALYARAMSGASDARAQAACERALELDPENVRGLTALGDVLLTSDASNALGRFERALSVDASDRDARLGAARALDELGRSEEARTQLAVLLRDEPFDVEVARVLLDVRRSDGASDHDLHRLTARIERFGADMAPNRRGNDAAADRSNNSGRSATVGS